MQAVVVDTAATLSIATSSSGDDNSLLTFDNIFATHKDSQECKSSPASPGTHLDPPPPPPVGLSKSLDGNKNKTGFLDLMIDGAGKRQKVDNLQETCITAEACDLVDTAYLNPVLDGNCDHNSLQFTEYGNNSTFKPLSPTHITLVLLGITWPQA